MKKPSGFTLIELMVVVAILGILAAIGYPSYQESIRKTNRADAKDALLQAAAAQEKFFFSNNAYSDDLSKLGFTATDGKFLSREKHYELGVTGPTCTSNGGRTFPCYTITAQPLGGQVKDKQCSVLSVDQTGHKKASTDASVDSSTVCW